MFPVWRSHLEQLPEEVAELHRSGFHAHLAIKWALPAFFLRSKGELSTVLSAEEFNGIIKQRPLMGQVMERLN